jgi:hypothetical protein
VEEQFLGRKRMEQDVRRIRTWIPQLIGPLQDTGLPFTSASWDGDSFSTTAKTVIDLSAVFGVPAGARWVQVYVVVRDDDAANTETTLILWHNNTAGEGIGFTPPAANDRWGRGSAIIPCDENGDIYYQITASGANTFDVYLQIMGYFL